LKKNSVINIANDKLSYSVNFIDLKTETNTFISSNILRIKIPKNNLYSSQISFIDAFSKKVNCIPNSINPAEVIYNAEFKDGGYVMTAENAEYCTDIFNSKYIPTDANYLISTDYENIEGYPLGINVYNDKLNYYFDRYLLPDTKFRTINYRLIYERSASESGMKISIHDLSRSSFKSINKLDGFNIQMFPSKFITEIYEGNEYKTTNSIKVISSERILPFLYKIKVQGEGYIGLAQTYSSKWIIVGNNSQSEKMSGWGNAWYVSAPDGLSTYIVYTQQILQFIGYLFIISLIFGLILV
jgi:hypothetical protein